MNSAATPDHPGMHVVRTADMEVARMLADLVQEWIYDGLRESGYEQCCVCYCYDRSVTGEQEVCAKCVARYERKAGQRT